MPRSFTQRSLDIITWGILVGAVGFFGASYLRSRAPSQPLESLELNGTSLAGIPYGLPFNSSREDTLLSRLGPAANLVYVFGIACEFCTEQREHVASLLAEVRDHYVITISTDPPDSLEGYWNNTALSEQVPIGIPPGVAVNLQLNRVPTLLVVDSSGRVLSSLRGQMLGWGRQELINYLDRVHYLHDGR